jgi:methylenetetrahydrofolate dehydrogenase (NADP+) / methenyltetrahydrofolate cyclohydrolase
MILDGKIITRQLLSDLSDQSAECREHGQVPTLAIVMATTDEGAAWYVRSIQKTAEKCGVAVRLIELNPTADTEVIADALQEQAADSSVHGLILQTPLPDGVAIDSLLSLIPLAKDVDGASPLAAGYLAYGLPSFVPATAAAVMKMLEYYHIPLTGKHAVVVGRSRIVGKPVAQLLLQAHATVTICHSRSADLARYTREADILVVAAGKPGLITPTDVQPDATVIDVGTNVTADNALVGDVDPAVGSKTALSPVPGGIGPITTALLLQHTVTAARTRT